MWSTRLVDLHFWVATIGIVLYIASMWIAGVMQGLMWRAVNPDGTLTYTFVEGVKATYPYYVIRFGGGLLYLTGMLMMAYNTGMTLRRTVSVDPRIPTMKPEHKTGAGHEVFA
jgi:cytochrome c oxidase cbb3-type subunit 1